jgi:hypothetical protein
MAIPPTTAGIVSKNKEGALVKNCYTNVDWSEIIDEGDYYSGIGTTTDGNIINSFNVNKEGFGLMHDWYDDMSQGIVKNCYFDANRVGTTTFGGQYANPEGYEDSNYVNEDDSNPDYFYNKNNSPMNEWDFDTIWQENVDGYPTLQWTN